MKILFCADIHIKLGQKNVPVDWARNRFNMFIKQLGEYQERADIVVIGGDTFDRVPSMDELELYFNLVASMTKPTFIYSGNHEMLKKDSTFLSNLKEVTNLINNKVMIVDDYYYLEEADLDIIPYNKLKDFVKEKHDENFSGKILATHVRGEIPPHVKPEIPLELFDRWKVVLAGDLHSYDNCQRNILYPGSPYTTSFHRSTVDTGVILLDSETLEHVWLKFQLPQLIRKTISAGESMEPTEFHHTVYEVEGSLDELANVSNTELLDKKVTKKERDVNLILTSDMTIRQELSEYLEFVAGLEGTSLKEVLNLFDDLEHLLKHD